MWISLKASRISGLVFSQSTQSAGCMNSVRAPKCLGAVGGSRSSGFSESTAAPGASGSEATAWTPHVASERSSSWARSKWLAKASKREREGTEALIMTKTKS